MKEYICKEDIKKNFHNDLYHLYGWGWSFTDIDKTIDSTSTVTKADICREFAGEIVKILNGIDRDIAVMIKDIVEEDILAEMEKGE